MFLSTLAVSSVTTRAVSSQGVLRYDTHDVFPSVAFLLITFWNKIFFLTFMQPEAVAQLEEERVALDAATVWGSEQEDLEPLIVNMETALTSQVPVPLSF